LEDNVQQAKGSKLIPAPVYTFSIETLELGLTLQKGIKFGHSQSDKLSLPTFMMFPSQDGRNSNDFSHSNLNHFQKLDHRKFENKNLIMNI
jgi:hypothetical protein